jgi:hypothetical protein
MSQDPASPLRVTALRLFGEEYVSCLFITTIYWEEMT